MPTSISSLFAFKIAGINKNIEKFMNTDIHFWKPKKKQNSTLHKKLQFYSEYIQYRSAMY